MHLKSLTLRGFKSFASATTLRFEPGITCVVGPNGSGKSNVVDALSWVMGEQGAKSLRGGKMEDVIFAGTSGRPPLGRAEVSLTIDNGDGALPIEYAEVTLTRTMFRNGGSEYRLNGDTCRLLDIQELLSDSGIGREMHVIVGQGQLDSVLHADATGRRAFIEEAAGVLKHRKRKEKALRKLDAMQANLTRVQDLVAELRRQLKPLGRQAQAARRAAVVQAELRDARLRLLADDLVTLREALRSELADEAELKRRRAEAEAELAASRRREAQLEDRAARLAPGLARTQDTWHRLSRLAERVHGTVGLARQRVRHASSVGSGERPPGRDPEETECEAARIREQEAELAEALDAARAALEEAEELRAGLEDALADEDRRLREAARAAADRREGLARLHARAGAARDRAAAARAETDRLGAVRDEAAGRAQAAREEYEELRARVEDAEAGGEGLEAELEEAAQELAGAERAHREARQEATRAEREHAALSARHEALALGLRRKDGSGALLAAGERLTGLLGPAAELLTAAPGHEVPVAAALGAAADAVAVSGPEAAVEALNLLRKEDAGRAALILAAERAPEPAAVARDGGPGDGGPDDGGPAGEPPAGALWAASLVSGPERLLPAVRRLLHKVVVVPSLEEAGALVTARPDLTAVTAEGDVLGTHFAHGGSAGAPSLLEVRAAVDEAAAELGRLAVRCAAAARAQQEAQERRTRCADRVEELARARRRADKEKSAVDRQLGLLGGQARAAEAEAERAAAAVEHARASLEEAQERAGELGRRLAEAEAEAEAEAGGGGAPAHEEPDTSRRDRLAEEGADARRAETEARLAVRTHEERVRALAGRADALDRAARAEREARARARAHRARAAREAAVAGAVAAGAQNLLRHVEASLARAEQDRAAAERERAGCEAELTAERARGRELEAVLDALTDSVHRGEVLGAEKRARIGQLEAKALEDHGVEPETLIAEYGPDRPVPASPPAPGEELPEDPEHPRNRPRPFDRAEQEGRLAAAEKAFARLGRVNPLALEEFAALEERHKFLTEQLEDLRRTRADLLAVVKEVDERVEQVFSAAFHDTAREFEGVFSRLFPGGEGRLVLTDPGDMLSTGVEVEARPPGKKVKRLSLLSGGERSLTAVAVLVAIFKARPSPFYVMDEVEAALDDTNLQRLIGLLRELRDASQLIVITHQKRTMEVADALYGVSMQGDGVSKVVSQRLR
ncbi:chromosome segregation protein SMC [Streptomyces sp. SCUT-3]|uniref:chromosome segregation protein SMC n=1 Tax=Streptomyces sp. SCUT-3 TaxID=2684469 RepID=UPI0015FBD8AB|nr:chromosome segregation protein SMC [Streptomyces sp. SCUT-3]QMV21594.1 chromosome segregation protein SMC [Streptomyces sp. SCUT-3]